MEELIKLAKEKGFQTKTVTTKFTVDVILGSRKNVLVNDTCNYLVLCEIQKWLREVHGLVVESKISKTYFWYHWVITYKRKETNTVVSVGDPYQKYYEICEQALEIGLLEGLKLIELNE